ncbi:MAG TPA: hypothetical protein VN541_24105, partial [Tepidisphaeraceae bacterium]|nr:hypothetical protein [Tepidisphaeraceae bacterium]
MDQFSGTGDGNLMATIDHPGTAKNPDNTVNPERVTQSLFDWRDRQIAQKGGSGSLAAGVAGPEDNVTGRPIEFFTLDNLGEVTETDQYDGDNIPLSDFADGLSNLPAADQNQIVARTIDSFDELGQLYKEQVFSVANGVVAAANLATNFYYDFNGNMLAESDPGGLVTKHQYDAADRDIKDSSTDGSLINGGSMSWAEANDSTGANDVVIEQTINKLDADGNVIETIDRQRFDNDPATATGDLAGPSGGSLASRDYYSD